MPAHRPVKRRASRACLSCRARKVRCNVVEHGAPCTNCRLDEVECRTSESRRRKTSDARPPPVPPAPHVIGMPPGGRGGLPPPGPPPPPGLPPPPYIRPLPPRILPEDAGYLHRKGALTIPGVPLRDALLRAYAEWVHGDMPVLDLAAFLHRVDRPDGARGSVSLLLFQAVMFAGTAFVDLDLLRQAGHGSRKAARKAFFGRVRLLYDFDYEVDRITLVQALLLMTHWYETPNEQKDTWHWMGVATSLAHTIGLHRDPARSRMAAGRQKLWKRLWWSCFMRDRLVALGMRRPTRIKREDCDVPMLAVDDFDLDPLPPSVGCIPADCILRSPSHLHQRAVLCIEKARLSLCISHVLTTQYSVLHDHHHGEATADGHTQTTMMLLPKRGSAAGGSSAGSAAGGSSPSSPAGEVGRCQAELDAWAAALPPAARVPAGGLHSLHASRGAVITLHVALLAMFYHTTLSALHRPQVLPAASASPPAASPPPASSTAPPASTPAHTASREHVKAAATRITQLAQALRDLRLVRYLPTTGVTVLLPAVIVHLLDIRSADRATRHASRAGFVVCMHILHALRDTYAAADFATSFLEAAMRKANVVLPKTEPLGPAALSTHPSAVTAQLTPPPERDPRSGLASDPPAEIPLDPRLTLPLSEPDSILGPDDLEREFNSLIDFNASTCPADPESEGFALDIGGMGL